MSMKWNSQLCYNTILENRNVEMWNNDDNCIYTDIPVLVIKAADSSFKITGK